MSRVWQIPLDLLPRAESTLVVQNITQGFDTLSTNCKLPLRFALDLLSLDALGGGPIEVMTFWLPNYQRQMA